MIEMLKCPVCKAKIYDWGLCPVCHNYVTPLQIMKIKEQQKGKKKIGKTP